MEIVLICPPLLDGLVVFLTLAFASSIAIHQSGETFVHHSPVWKFEAVGCHTRPTPSFPLASLCRVPWMVCYACSGGLLLWGQSARYSSSSFLLYGTIWALPVFLLYLLAWMHVPVADFAWIMSTTNWYLPWAPGIYCCKIKSCAAVAVDFQPSPKEVQGGEAEMRHFVLWEKLAEEIFR